MKHWSTPRHNTSTRLIGAATAKDAWLILFWFLRQFYVIKRQIAAESTFFKFFSTIWKPSQAFYAVAATVALCKGAHPLFLPTSFWKSNPPQNSNFSPNQLPKIGYFCLSTPKIRFTLLICPRISRPSPLCSPTIYLVPDSRPWSTPASNSFLHIILRVPEIWLSFRLPVSPLNSKCK